MQHTRRASRGMVVAPHHLAAESGLAILREGGNAIEAAVAAAATLTVVYPHMNTLGGDNFWLVAVPGGGPVAIEACGPAATLASASYYREKGLRQLPPRGASAALTVAGAVAGWEEALNISRNWGGRLPLTRLLADAEHYAREGYPVSAGQSEATTTHLRDLALVSGYADQFVPGGRPPAEGDVLRQPALADTLGQLGRAGLGDFYRGGIARSMIDGDSRAVSLIQSIYWPFGSGVVLPGTGVLWQNRGVAFSLEEGTLRSLAPGRRPFHTLNPALARLDDGRLMVYGCMGGEGQPQTPAAGF